MIRHADDVFLALVIVGLISNFILIVGVLVDQPKFFFPQIFFGCAATGLTAFRAFLYVYHLEVSKFGRNFPYRKVGLLILPVVVFIYFVVCVLSYYREVTKRRKEAKETVVLPTSALFIIKGTNEIK
jgi:hypothetical protein